MVIGLHRQRVMADEASSIAILLTSNSPDHIPVLVSEVRLMEQDRSHRHVHKYGRGDQKRSWDTHATGYPTGNSPAVYTVFRYISPELAITSPRPSQSPFQASSSA
jgi:hypothetical protein